MSEDGMVYKNARTKVEVRARQVPGTRGRWEPDTDESLDPREWMPGVIDRGVFLPGDFAVWHEMEMDAGSARERTGTSQDHP